MGETLEGIQQPARQLPIPSPDARGQSRLQSMSIEDALPYTISFCSHLHHGVGGLHITLHYNSHTQMSAPRWEGR